MVGTSSMRTFESVAFVKLQIIHLLNLNLQCNVPLTRVRPLANTGLLSCGLSKLPGDFGNVRVQSGDLHPPLGGLHPPTRGCSPRLTFEDTPWLYTSSTPHWILQHVCFKGIIFSYFWSFEWLLTSQVTPNFKFPDHAEGAYGAPQTL